MRLGDLCVTHLPRVVEFQVALDVLAQLQGLQRGDRDLPRQADLSSVVENIIQQSLEFGAHLKVLDFHFYLSLV